MSLENAIEQNLVANNATAKYAINKLNTLGAILQAVSKTGAKDGIIFQTFAMEDLVLIKSIVNFACTVMLYEPEDTKLSKFITQVVAKAA